MSFIHLLAYTLVSSLLAITINGQQYAVGVRQTVFKRNSLEYLCNRSGPQCGDCRTLIICATFSYPVQTIQCQHPTPHCVMNSCQANATDNCIFEPPFTCTSPGAFPDPFDCTRYRVCYPDDPDQTNGVLYACPVGYIFNSKLTLCEKLPSTTQSCGKIDCSKSAGKTVLHPSNPAFYAFCFDHGNGTIVPMMFKCEFEQFETFNISMGMCMYNCKAKGHFGHPGNSKQYYVCSGAGAMGDLVSCPHNYVFDGVGCITQKYEAYQPPMVTTTSTPGPVRF